MKQALGDLAYIIMPIDNDCHERSSFSASFELWRHTANGWSTAQQSTLNKTAAGCYAQTLSLFIKSTSKLAEYGDCSFALQDETCKGDKQAHSQNFVREEANHGTVGISGRSINL